MCKFVEVLATSIYEKSFSQWRRGSCRTAVGELADIKVSLLLHSVYTVCRHIFFSRHILNQVTILQVIVRLLYYNIFNKNFSKAILVKDLSEI